MPIIIKSDDEIAIMRQSGSIVAQTMQKLLAELLAHYRAAGKLKDVDGMPEIPFVTMAIVNALGAHGDAARAGK